MLNLSDFQRPRFAEVNQGSLTDSYGEFVAYPFERGFATTSGHALRRVLLSSIQGAAVTNVRIKGVQHEFTTLPGVWEDITHIMLNLKEIPFKLHNSQTQVVTLSVKGEGKVTSAAIRTNQNVEVLDPNVHIATLGADGELEMEIVLRVGRGFVTADRNFDESLGLGYVPLDSNHSPISRVNYLVEPARVGQSTDYEKLTLQVWTNATVSPRTRFPTRPSSCGTTSWSSPGRTRSPSSPRSPGPCCPRSRSTSGWASPSRSSSSPSGPTTVCATPTSPPSANWSNGPRPSS